MEQQEQEKPWGYAKCFFGDVDKGKHYDYVAPFPVAAGDKVKVEHREGGWTRVTVAAVVTESETARAKILEIIPPEPETEQEA